jgi:hypothetical protein
MYNETISQIISLGNAPFPFIVQGDIQVPNWLMCSLLLFIAYIFYKVIRIIFRGCESCA